jgi:hypothetical protein
VNDGGQDKELDCLERGRTKESSRMHRAARVEEPLLMLDIKQRFTGAALHSRVAEHANAKQAEAVLGEQRHPEVVVAER